MGPQSFASVDAIVDELDILLTSGRLQTENKDMIKSLVEPFMADGSKAVRAAQQLILNTIFSPSSLMDSFGCVRKVRHSHVIDSSTRHYPCDRKELHDQEAGLIISSSQMSIAQGLRIYAHSGCKWCDAVTYTLQGRAGPDSAWSEIGSGDLPWINFMPARNAKGSPISSTYESGDASKIYTEVRFPSNADAFLDYRFTFTTRDPTSRYLRIAELEVPGILLP